MASEELQELTDLSQIVDVRFFRVEAKFDLEKAASGTDDRAEAEEDVNFLLTMNSRGDGRGLVAVLECTVLQQPALRYAVEVSGLYEVEGWEDGKYSEETVRAFGDRVAMFQLLPFVREGIADLATRLRLRVPILPLMPRDLGPADLVHDEDFRADPSS